MKIGMIAAALALAAPMALASEDPRLTGDARDLAVRFQQSLAGTLLAEIQASGPAAAIGVCSTAAVAVASELSRHEGMRVTRVSLKVRNPMLGIPDAWEQRVLQDFEARLAKGEAPAALEFAATVDEPQGRYFRYMKALPVQELCLACHGPEDRIPADVKARLMRDYPKDRATGYRVGQIRGAISVKRPL